MTAQLKDAVYGAAVGDALGVPFEFRSRGSFTCEDMAEGGSHGQPMGTWSDDTSMMLATCASIRHNNGSIDVEDMRRRFRDWAFRGEYAINGNVFDIGNTVSSALHEGRGLSGDRSNGNGSLMRIAPLAFCDATDDEIRAVSAITHAHFISTESCVAFVRVLRDVLAGANVCEAAAKIQVGKYSFDPEKPRDDLRSGGYVLDTLDSALWCASNTETYADCVITAVNLGRDTDTTACVAGALAGVMYGIDAIPASWMSVLRGKDIIEECLF